MAQRPLTVEEVCRKLKPLYGDKIDQIYLRYSMAESREEKEEIFHILSALYSKNLSQLLDNSILLEPPKADFVKGEYPLAKVSYAKKKLYDFGLRERDWPRHVCISGMSGSGKTNLAFNVIENFLEKDKPFIVFDWKKSFRPLLAKNNNVMCFTVGNNSVTDLFQTNINRPPEGISPKEWITILCDLLAESFNVSYGVHKVLLETLDEMFEGWEVYEYGKYYPTWHHIKKMLEDKARKAKGREATWIESALRIATVLTFGAFGNVVNNDEDNRTSIEDLMKKKVVFELNALGNIEKRFFCEYILTYIYKMKKAQQNNSENEFESAILVDEAHNIFLKDKTNFAKESVTDMVYREMREYGISLICLDQHVSKLSDTVKGNSACHIAFQQQLPQDIQDISGIMNMRENKEQFSHLPVGSAIVKLSERYTSPFLIEVPKSTLREKTLNDDEILSRMKALLSGMEVEKKVDPEFSEAVVNGGEVKDETVEIPKVVKRKFMAPMFSMPVASNEKVETEEVTEKPEVESHDEKIENNDEKFEEKPKVRIVDGLNEVQSVLYDFVKSKVMEGRDLYSLEKLLDGGAVHGYYTRVDVMKVVNKVLSERIKQNLYSKTIIPKKFEDKEVKQMNVEPVVEYELKNESVLDGLELSDDEKKFMEFLIENPEHEFSTVDLYKVMGFSPRKGNVLKEKLESKDLITIEELKHSKGWKKIVRPRLSSIAVHSH